MKRNSIIISFFLALALISCKKEVSDTPKVEAVNDNLFKVTLDLNIKENDTLHLYYTEDGSINFNEENSIWQSILGKTESQPLTFSFPENTIPTELRLDFGVNVANEEILINGVKLEYNNKTFEAKGADVFKFFRLDENVTLQDVKTKGLKRKDPKRRNGASLYPLEIPLKTEIDKLVK